MLLPERRFEFIPLWGVLVFFLYQMRRVSCSQCGVVVEYVPWGDGKHQLTEAYSLVLARRAGKVSWKETALSFNTTWDKVRDPRAERRQLGAGASLGVDEIQYAKGHKYHTLVYQIDSGLTRLLWVGKERTTESVL
jgi:transposase